MDRTLPSIPVELQARLRQCQTLPSPPKLALQIIALIQDPDITIEKVVEALSKDPALVVKILRLANSAYYAHQRKVSTIEKAIMIVGLNGILSFSLSFSLVQSFRTNQLQGLNFQWYWLRALIAGSACRSLAEICHRHDTAELFTAGLIQDTGMMAIDQIEPEFYASHDVTRTPHQQIMVWETEQFGVSHAVIGSWLFSQWNFPTTLALAPLYSDESHPRSSVPDQELFFKFVALACSLADIFLLQSGDDVILSVADRLESELGHGALALPTILKSIGNLAQEHASIYDIECGDEVSAELIYEKARDLLVARAMQSPQPLDVLLSEMISHPLASEDSPPGSLRSQSH
ncbi:MAG: HDOD domain-containing protein [Nitrospirales bacterium]|nr:HDOD domain-containing protein [Nitrospira sp.]MDR4500843.1 HDOD domain-containing protein [Nitrospirales bacterium]